MKDNKQTHSKRFYRSRVLRRFRRNKLAVVGWYFILVLTSIAILADFLAYDKPIVAKFDDHFTSPVVLKYTVGLGIAEWPEGYPPSRLEFRFEAKDDGTEVTMIHSEVPASQAEAYRQGWVDYYWTPLKEYFSNK